MSIIGIVAVDRKGAIGKGGKLPWHYSSDMKFFKQTTTGHACVMGWNTWLTLKHPLKDRLNIVLSRKEHIQENPSVVVMRDLESVLALNRTLPSDLFVIGGAKVYTEFVPYIEKWIVTEVPLTIEGADTFMPSRYLEGFHQAGIKELDEGLIVKYYDRV